MWLSVHPAGAPENLARFPKGLNIGRYHSSGHTIYMWSIADAWEWFVHIPVLGFILVLILALFVIFMIFLAKEYLSY